MGEEISVTITRQDKYRFLVDFGPAIAPTVADEPPPLGDAPAPPQRSSSRPPSQTAYPQAFSSPTANSRKIPDV